MLWNMLKLKEPDIVREYQAPELDGNTLEIQVHGRLNRTADSHKLSSMLIKAFQKKEQSPNSVLLENSQQLNNQIFRRAAPPLPDHERRYLRRDRRGSYNVKIQDDPPIKVIDFYMYSAHVFIFDVHKRQTLEVMKAQDV